MINSLVKKSDNLTKQFGELLDKENLFSQITTRAVDDLFQFHTFDETKIAKIAEVMPEINRATRAFGRQNTQTTSKFMSLTMLADTSPFRVIRQCLSQIENRRLAIKENRFKLLKDKVELERLEESKGNLNKFDAKLKKIKAEELTSKIADAALYIEGALKEIALYQSIYQQVCKNNKIPEKWDEEDAEKAEVKHHLRMAFLHAYRDILNHGTLGMGTLEYLQQFGVHPHIARAAVEGYIIVTQEKLKQKQKVDYEDLEVFLDDMVETFKDEYKKVLKRLGLDSLYETWYMYKEEPE